jgi:membrane-associated protease RseP (regulator of RpoE activity)
MRRLLILAFLAAVAVPATAQERPHEDRDTAAVRARGFDYYYGPDRIRVGSFQRGRLGILVDLTPDPARDSIGARVAGVSPGGAAEKAGVRTGDIVVRLNGTALVSSTSRSGGGGEPGVSRPGTRLIELASRLDPGDSVHLDLRRDGRPVRVTLVAQESGVDEIVRHFRFDVPGHDEPFGFAFPRGEMDFAGIGGPLASIELVKVNSGLADYFGTSEGLLVVSVGSDSTLGLRNGDVILSIGGRKPMSPAHALRVLGTYEPSETVTFEVMRMKRRISVSGKMPERRRPGWTVSPNSYEMQPFMRPPGPWAPAEDLPRMLLDLPPLSGLAVPGVGLVAT